MKTFNALIHPNGQHPLQLWNPTYNHHHVPRWFSKAVRLWAIEKGTWRTGGYAIDHLPQDIFDHWGSAKIDGKTVVITQPYGYGYTEELPRIVRQFAEEMGCIVKESPDHGPWHEYTFLFIFEEK